MEAPTYGSVILAACLLKLGTFGFLRFLPIFFYRSFLDLLIWVSLLGGVFSSCYCCFTTDLKVLIAFSSVFHMSFLFRNGCCGREASFFSSLALSRAHGFLSALLFFLVG